MDGPSTSREIAELLHTAGEYARYLQELGVGTIAESALASAESSAQPAEAFSSSAGNLETQGATLTPVSNPSTRESRSRTIAPSKSSQDALFAQAEPMFVATPSVETLEDIWRDIGGCTRCGLCEGRTQVVNTHGHPKARLMFIGEAPGADEDAQGKPFVGRAGQLLTKMIEAMGMKREDVIIGNVNRCRPPGNRQPTLEEAAICRPFLFREIAAIQPDVIVVMGNTALRNLLEMREGITRVRGRFHDFRGIKVMPTFHPAYLLRDPSKKRETWEDLKKVRDYLDSLPPKR